MLSCSDVLREGLEVIGWNSGMSELRVETFDMPAGRLGPPSPLAPFVAPKPPSKGMHIDESVPEEDRKYIGYGSHTGCLPHRLQDDYGRVSRLRSFHVAVLENENLRATFLLELGGRLWRLFHKPSGRELLDGNPVFQPANLAALNAWFSGGVEWNVGIQAHTPYTCSPLFAARAQGDDGTPVLRLYEWDRMRETPYQMDFYLPDGSPWLFVRVRIINPNERETPMYWWSNIAVAERPDVRILVPADHAYKFGYKGGLGLAPIPIFEGVDVSYPSKVPSSTDFFYRVPDGRRPWIAALDEAGCGLVQASTSRLKGRKMFVWGMGPGGRRWQEYLSPGAPYLELQAGLARTQAECLPMPPAADWSWLEAYGLIEADPAVVHGSDWSAACETVESRLSKSLPQHRLEDELRRSEVMANRPPEEILQRGSGWGALERRRRQSAGERPFCSDAMVFDDASLGDDQSPWLALLDGNALPERSPTDLPGAWIVQAEWRELLERSVQERRGDHWLARLHLGVMYYHAGEIEAAKQAWELSLDMAPSPWAYRNLAVAAKHEGRSADAADLLLKACRMVPDVIQLSLECCDALIGAGRQRELMDFLDTLPTDIRSHGRVRIFEARAALDIGDLEKVNNILESATEVADIREGEVTLTDLWFSMHEKRIAAAEKVAIDDALKERVRREFPPPAALDFRMSVKSSESPGPGANSGSRAQCPSQP